MGVERPKIAHLKHNFCSGTKISPGTPSKRNLITTKEFEISYIIEKPLYYSYSVIKTILNNVIFNSYSHFYLTLRLQYKQGLRPMRCREFLE